MENCLKHPDIMLVNDFYSGLLVHSDEHENPNRFDHDVLYTFIDGQEWVITEFDLGKLLGCEFYRELFEAPRLIMFGTL